MFYVYWKGELLFEFCFYDVYGLCLFLIYGKFCRIEFVIFSDCVLCLEMRKVFLFYCVSVKFIFIFRKY